MTSEDAETQCRAAVMKRLEVIVQKGVDADVASYEKRLKANPASVFTPKWRHFIKQLRSQGFDRAMQMLVTYETETLEYIAENFSAPRSSNDCLHMWTSYNDEEWNRVAGENRDAMLMDYISIRSGGFMVAGLQVHALNAVYQFLGVSPGDIRLMSAEDARRDVMPVFMIATASQSALRLRNKFVTDEDLKVTDEYRSVVIPEESLEYVRGRPGNMVVLRQYMMKRKQTVEEVNFEHFLEWAGVHGSLRVGAL